MLSIFAILRDIPAYIAALVSQLTGYDASAILDVVNFGIRDIFEIIDRFAA